MASPPGHQQGLARKYLGPDNAYADGEKGPRGLNLLSNLCRHYYGVLLWGVASEEAELIGHAFARVCPTAHSQVQRREDEREGAKGDEIVMDISHAQARGVVQVDAAVYCDDVART